MNSRQLHWIALGAFGLVMVLLFPAWEASNGRRVEYLGYEFLLLPPPPPESWRPELPESSVAKMREELRRIGFDEPALDRWEKGLRENAAMMQEPAFDEPEIRWSSTRILFTFVILTTAGFVFAHRNRSHDPRTPRTTASRPKEGD